MNTCGYLCFSAIFEIEKSVISYLTKIYSNLILKKT